MNRVPLALLATSCAAALLAGCGQPADPKPSTEDAVASRSLDGLLLDVDELGQAMGAPMAITESKTSLGDVGWLSDKQCAGPWTAAAKSAAYSDPQPSEVRYEVVQATDRSGSDMMLVKQAVIAMPDSDSARTVFDNAAGTWSECSNTEVTAAAPDGELQRWMFGDLASDHERGDLTLTRTQTSSTAQCQHTLRVRQEIIVDVATCGFNIVSQGVKIADQIAGRVTAS